MTRPELSGPLFWYACDHPERPADAFVMWHYRHCQGCRIAAAATLFRYPDDSHVQWLNTQMSAGNDRPAP